MSDLLNKASLVMVPSGYKEDTVYSVVPTDGSGDLSFTRASNGTRINSSGLVEVCPWNLAQYSEEFNNAIYVVKDAVTIVDNSTTAPNGTTTADLIYPSSSGSYRYVAQEFTQAENIYTISVYAKAQNKNVIWMYIQSSGSTGIVYFDLSDGTMSVTAGSFSTPIGTITAVGNGWYRCTYTLGANLSLSSGSGFGVCDAKGNVYATASGTNGVYFWGAQLNIGSTAKPYFPTTDRLNVPRLTYQNGGGGCPSLLLEKQSTNVVTYSEQFDNAAWTKSGSNSVTANATTSPDGTQNADFVVSTATNSSPKYVYQVISSIATPTATIYAKAGAVTEMMFYCQGGNGIYFNLTNGAFVAYYSGGASTITSYSSVAVGNGWYRYSITFNTSVTSIEAYMASGSSISPSIANGDGFYLWGAQLEASSYATSYIPTTSSSATRVADACYKTGISSLIGQTEGTLFFELQRNDTDNDTRLQISDGSGANWLFVSIETGLNPRAYCNVNGVNQFSVYGSAVSNSTHKVAFAYKNNDFKVYIDGVASITQTSGSVPACNQIDVGSGSPNGSVLSTSLIKEVVLFPTRLTNAELASLTTI